MIKFYEGPYQQQGAGFGGFFRGLMKFVQPVINSPITKKIAGEVLKTGIGIGSDMIAGKTFKESASENLNKTKKRVKDVIKNINPSNSDDGSEDEDIEISSPVFKKRKITKMKKHSVSHHKRRRTIFD